MRPPSALMEGLRVRGWASGFGVSLLVVALVAGAAAAKPRADQETAGDILGAYPESVTRRLMRDKFVMIDNGGGQNASGLVQALVVFEQPRSRTLLLLAQTARQTEYRPELKSVETVARSEGATTDEHRMKIMFMKIDYHVRTHYDYKRSRISWKLDPDFDNDLEEIEGYWELYELDEHRTLGKFGTKVSMGPAMPLWLQEYATRKNVPQTLNRMRRWVDSNGTYRP